VREQPKDKGDRPSKNGKLVPAQEPVSLAELGITKKESSAWQKLAAAPKEKLEARLQEAREAKTSHHSATHRTGPPAIQFHDSLLRLRSPPPKPA
jgi:hypothetical protein